METRIAVVGLGQMGGRIAKRLAAQGRKIGVFDRDPARLDELAKLGATPYESLAQLAAQHDVVLTVLPDAAIVRQVVLDEGGLAAHLRPGSVLVDMTTSVPAVTREIAAALSARGVGMLDAPVSGGVQKADTGALTIMIGGAESVLQDVRPVLEDVGETLIHVGEIGAGHIAKALNNLITATSLAVTSEALAAGVKMGVDARKLLDVINAGSGRSAASEMKFPQQILSRRFAPGFSVALMSKDVGIAVDMAREAGAPVQVATAVQALWKQAVQTGRGDMDHSAIALVVEEMAGVEIRGA